MSYSKIDIINQGVGKFSSSYVQSIDPPRTSLERRCALYPQWKESEIAKRRWVFARDLAYDLPNVTASTNPAYLYRYELPAVVLRPIRQNDSEWSQAGRYIFSNTEDLTIPVVLNVNEAQFDPLFVDVLAARIMMETIEHVTQSRGNKEDGVAWYNDAVSHAAKANAFVIGPEKYSDNDDNYGFITGRW